MGFKTVSVLIPSYNHSHLILETITSCIDQNYEGLIEIIIVDDCSSDNTLEVIKQFENYSVRNRSIRIIQKSQNLGINDSLEKGLGVATGDYIQILASDDLILPNKIKSQVEFLQKYDYDCVYSRGYFYYDKNNKTEFFLNSFKEAYEDGNGLQYVSSKDWDAPLAQSALFTQKCFSQLIPIRSKFKSDDWAMLIELFKNYKVAYLDKALFLYRQHDNNTFKRYNYTFPMRVEVISNLVDECFKPAAFSNIFYSQALYLYQDSRYRSSFKFSISSFFMKFNISALKLMLRILYQIVLVNNKDRVLAILRFDSKRLDKKFL